jgi:hypothetical protein
MSSAAAAPRAAGPVSNARAEASRRNGAKSRGPRTPEGKTRSAQNALKHGLRAERYVVLPDEEWEEFAALETALKEELAPEGALQGFLAGRVARAAWRLMRAERLEVELLQENHLPNRSLGLALIRDGNGTRSMETLLRYRGAAQAELWRSACSRRCRPSSRSQPVPPLRRIRSGARHGHRSSIARNRTNPSAARGPDRNPLSPSRPRAVAPCTSRPPPGCRTNPMGGRARKALQRAARRQAFRPCPPAGSGRRRR